LDFFLDCGCCQAVVIQFQGHGGIFLLQKKGMHNMFPEDLIDACQIIAARFVP
jgi:glycosylphosphatidylinositol transamidase (GPIT) subunit GPI8